jgi:hypothetical protein
MKWFKSLSEPMRIALITGIFAVIAAIVGSIIAGIFVLASKTPSQTTNLPIVTSQVTTTQTIVPRPSVTPIPTATIPAIATLDASLTNPYPPHQGTLALNTSFTTIDSKWNGSSNCQFTNQAYSVTTDHGFMDCLENLDSYCNFVFQVQLKFLTKDTCGGILFRVQSNPYVAQSYEFYICTDNTYQFGYNFGLFYSLAKGSSLFNIGIEQANVIAIAARGTQFILYINGQMVNEGNDNNFPYGRIGVSARYLTDLKASHEVAFNDVKVWQL